MNIKKSGCLLGLLLVFVSCKKHDATTDNVPVHKTTPYNMVFPSNFPQPDIPSDNPMTVEGVKLGRYLFYDSTLSKDGTLACASCHKQNTAFCDAPNAVSKGIKADGYPKGTFNAMPVFNLAWSKPRFFWDGRVNTRLEDQILKPIQNPVEMHMDTNVMIAGIKARKDYTQMFQDAFGNQNINGQLVAKAIAQFLRSIVSSGSRYDQWQDSTHTGIYWKNLTTSERLGYILVASDPQTYPDDNGTYHRVKYTGLDCFHCHRPPLFTPEPGLDAMHNDGAGGGRNFKTPSLRNLGFSAPYMNDGSMKTLDEVIQHYNNGINPGDTQDPSMFPNRFEGIYNLELDQTEVDALKAFLNMLNDNTLATNKNYSNPFAK